MKICCNHGERDRCKNPAPAGHIMCDHCRVATGGYPRYIAHTQMPQASAKTETTSANQELVNANSIA